MTPRDWNEIEKMLEKVADRETAEAILSKLTEGVQTGFRTPVNITATKLSSSGSKFTGTGKGILHFMHFQSYDLVIDGKEWLTNMTGSTGQPIAIEFTNDFQFILKTSGNIGVFAVFY